MAKADGSYIKEIARIERQHLLMPDDFGSQPFDAQSRAALVEIIEDRHGKTSLIITSIIALKAVVFLADESEFKSEPQKSDVSDCKATKF